MFFIILKPVKEGSGVLTQICLIYSIECSEDSKQRNKYEGFHGVTLKNTLLESWGEEACVAPGVSLKLNHFIISIFWQHKTFVCIHRKVTNIMRLLRGNEVI